MSLPRSRPFRPWVPGTLLGASLVLLLTMLSGPSATGATPTPGHAATAPSAWNNTAVECIFGASAPTMTATAVGSGWTGMTIAAGAITETSLGLGLGATASLAGAAWTSTGESTAASYGVAYATTVPVRSVGGLALGTTTVTMAYSLPESPAGTTGKTVTVSLAIAGWPWQPLFPRLSANLSLAPADPRAEHLVENTTGGMQVTSVANASAQIDAYFTAPTSADASFGGGVPSVIAVTSAMLAGTAGSGTLTLRVGPGASNASAVGFSAPMQVVPPTPVITLPGHVRVPEYDLVAAIGAAVVVSLALAGVTRRARSTPSDLEYVKEEP